MLQVSYSFFNQLGPSKASPHTWFLVGTAARLALGLGLHTPSAYDGSSFDVQQRRKRIFFSIYMMDRVVSIALGRPFAIHDDDIEVTVPRRVMPTKDTIAAVCLVRPAPYTAPEATRKQDFSSRLQKKELACTSRPAGSSCHSNIPARRATTMAAEHAFSTAPFHRAHPAPAYLMVRLQLLHTLGHDLQTFSAVSDAECRCTQGPRNGSFHGPAPSVCDATAAALRI
ncbi:fungal specific transcription factor domain-containing protein [Purpureocillium lilacinum]|uniref:Fungal specific transcription factor domain-containing protein n=1 Tax=Purpureocillium lilacinum TaxID=33203 RepID=A0A179GJK0_PURLI|nr:fungal specific transcription factor domain-containing protein [Purpureocillium lilacinum]OAQ77992.1 fungal specific transcription factor domain-containing protein [Purpureocillium lilacinum]